MSRIPDQPAFGEVIDQVERETELDDSQVTGKMGLTVLEQDYTALREFHRPTGPIVDRSNHGYRAAIEFSVAVQTSFSTPILFPVPATAGQWSRRVTNRAREASLSYS